MPDAGVASPLADERVRSRMRSVFIHAEVDETLLQIAGIMQLARIRHLPVLEKGLLVGIVSHRDLLEFAQPPLAENDRAGRRAHLARTSVATVMRSSVRGVSPDTTLAEAAQEMLRHKIGCLPVVVPDEAGRRMVGLITESDLLAAAYLPRFDARTLEQRPA
jgi:acetoin utilization protein AcuB